jgi:hypothetical protein
MRAYVFLRFFSNSCSNSLLERLFPGLPPEDSETRKMLKYSIAAERTGKAGTKVEGHRYCFSCSPHLKLDIAIFQSRNRSKRLSNLL